jgi:hypothetical protein
MKKNAVEESMPKWLLLLLAIYLLVNFFFFLKGKLKDPMNPAGLKLSSVTTTLEKLKQQDV